jgi:hypothetical protein
MTERYSYDANGNKIDEHGNIIIEHAYLTSGSGEPLRLLRKTEEHCPSCGKGPTPNKLGILTESPGQETVHCLHCDYQLTRRPKPTPQNFRPMNSRMRGG